MNDEYLWDKSGEPDPEIQSLEEVLGSLKYQPKPLELPHDLIVVRRRRYYPYVAIAASLFIALLAAGFWLRLRDQSERPATEARVDQPKAAPANTIQRQDDYPQLVKKESVVAVKHPVRRKPSTGRNIGPKLTGWEREEALAAKRQLLQALRLASEKLNLAQKKTLNPATPGQIRNQHKVG